MEEFVLNALSQRSPILWPHNYSTGSELGENHGSRESKRTKISRKMPITMDRPSRKKENAVR